MNKNIIFTIIVILLSFLHACEGKLDSTIYDKLSNKNFPKTAEDARVLLNGVYYEFRGGEWGRYNSGNDSRLVNGLFCTDEFSCYWGGYWGSPFNFIWTPNDFPYTDMYSFVRAITKATETIGQIEEMDSHLLSDKQKAQYIAEIKASRGYWAYDIYNMYGPVPLIVTADDIRALNENTYKPRERPSAEWMVQTIEKDLKEAAATLPQSYPSAEFGRFTKGAAYMGLLKLYMHERNWQAAQATAEQIIALKQYALEPVYKNIWSIDNEQNKEIIFAICSSATIVGVPNNFRAHVLPSDWASPNNLPVTGWNGYKVPWEFYDTFDEKDMRRETLQRFYTNTSGKQVDARKTSPLGAIPVKYGEDPVGTGQDQGTDYIVYRYADVLLLLAEALNELNGPNIQSINLINEVRQRAFDPDSPIALSSYSNKETLRDYILKERGWELCFEGNRREDLIRHRRFVEFANDPSKMSNRNPNKQAKPHHELYPIPTKALNENPLFKQNSGY